MFTMILLLYLQQNLDVTLERASARGKYRDRAACEAAAVRLRGPVPIPAGYAAAWHDVQCMRIDRNVRVNDVRQPELGALLRALPPEGCQGSGAWRRIAQLCGPADAAGAQ
jgi:hypothetical protein